MSGWQRRLAHLAGALVEFSRLLKCNFGPAGPPSHVELNRI